MARKLTTSHSRHFSQVSGMVVIDGELEACNVHADLGFVTDIRNEKLEGIDPSAEIFWTRNAANSAAIRVPGWKKGYANGIPLAKVEPIMRKAGDKPRNLFDFIVWMTTNGGRDTAENQAKAADLITKAAVAYGVDLSTATAATTTEPAEPVEVEAEDHEDEEAVEAA